MPQYSKSPLGLVLYSEPTETNTKVGSYVITASGSNSLFHDATDPQSYSFDPSVNQYTVYSSDISTDSVIQYTQKSGNQAMTLRYSDFAYLKNLGVYPNNRLIIARRFASPVGDDLTILQSAASGQNNTGNNYITPVATLVSWVPDGEDFIQTSFGEQWVDGDTSFREILNELGHDVLMGDNKGKDLGSAIASGVNAVPLPGFTEGLQFAVFKQLGLTDLDASQLPYGNPNLVRKSKRRATAGKEGDFTGVKCKFNVKMVVEYEQKFINGIDPTVVYYDIIANALTFGTSESKFVFNGNAGNKFNEFINDIGSGDNNRIKQALLQFVIAISNSLKQVGNAIYAALANLKNIVTQQNSTTDTLNWEKLNSGLTKIANTIITGLVNKYKLRIISVVNSLTGTPSAPWHVTIGNPRRPIFSSGDMVLENVKITMGKTLAFNDLPSSVKLEFELESARDIGAQEIFKKLNCGKARTYSKKRMSFVDTDTTFTDAQIQAAQNNSLTTSLPSSAIVTVPAGQSLQASSANLIGKSVYPSGISGLTGIGYITTSKQNGSSTDYTIYPKANLPAGSSGSQIPVVFGPDGSVYDPSHGNAPGLRVGGWKMSDKNVNVNFNNTNKYSNLTLPGS